MCSSPCRALEGSKLAEPAFRLVGGLMTWRGFYMGRWVRYWIDGEEEMDG